MKQDKAFPLGPREARATSSIGDHWVWGDELREAQGLVRYKGRWITQQEKERRDAEDAARAPSRRPGSAGSNCCDSRSWRDRRSQPRGRRQLFEIRDPIAVTPLVQVFGGERHVPEVPRPHPGAIPGPEAAAALVTHVLAETDFDVRYVTMDALAKRKDPSVVPGLVNALGSNNPSVVNRAAWARGELKAVTAVPKLIPR